MTDKNAIDAKLAEDKREEQRRADEVARLDARQADERALDERRREERAREDDLARDEQRRIDERRIDDERREDERAREEQRRAERALEDERRREQAQAASQAANQEPPKLEQGKKASEDKAAPKVDAAKDRGASGAEQGATAPNLLRENRPKQKLAPDAEVIAKHRAEAEEDYQSRQKAREAAIAAEPDAYKRETMAKEGQLEAHVHRGHMAGISGNPANAHEHFERAAQLRAEIAERKKVQSQRALDQRSEARINEAVKRNTAAGKTVPPEHTVKRAEAIEARLALRREQRLAKEAAATKSNEAAAQRGV